MIFDNIPNYSFEPPNCVLTSDTVLLKIDFELKLKIDFVKIFTFDVFVLEVYLYRLRNNRTDESACVWKKLRRGPCQWHFENGMISFG